MGARADASLVAGLGFALSWALRQHTFYKADGDVYLMSIVEGNLRHPHHMLYKPLVAGLHRLLAPAGLSLYEAGVLASALGTGLGVGCACWAARCLGLGRRDAWLVALTMLSVPAVLFFATVVELHGVYLGFAGPALLATAALARRPTPARGVWLGLALALAYVGHASATLLPAVALGVCLSYPVQQGRTAQDASAARSLLASAWALCVPMSCAAAVLAACLGILPVLGRWLDLGVDTHSAAAYVVRDAAAFASDPRRWASTLWFEWLLPYAPCNALALVLCFAGRWRTPARWLHLAVAPYYLLCVFLLPSPEFGAYLTPLAWPLALLVVRALRPVAVVGVAALGFAGGLAWISAHDQPELARRFAAGASEAAQARPFYLLLGDHDDVKATLVGLPDTGSLMLLHAGAVAATQLPAVLDRLDALLREQWRAGRAVLLTAGAVRQLDEVVPSGPQVLPGLQSRYDLVAVDIRREDAVFSGWRLHPK
ncbi:MAG: hypothetical protein R3F56_11595 [Planctomycetota bacterium]